MFCLPSLGMCRYFPWKLVFATFDYMGLNFLHLFTIQEIYRIKDIIFHTANDTLTGRLYTSSLELLLLELGCNKNFSRDPILIELLATDSLIKATWSFMYTYGIYMIHSVNLQLPRENDQFIMEAFINLRIPSHELKICNHCRIFLRAFFLSDIATGGGDYILESAWQGDPYITPHKIKSWPSYGKPSKSSWEIWRKWLRIAFLGRGRRLKAPLGNWRMFDPNWPWYLSKDGDLLELDSGIWYAHKPVLRRNRLPTFDIERRQIEAPSTFQRVTTYTNKSRIVCTGAATIMHQEVPQHRTFKAFLQADQRLHWCIHNVHIEDEELLKELYSKALL
jgi:hypothetical protein